MIKLSEILHTIRDEKKTGLIPVDRWNMLHADFLEDMGFKADGVNHYAIEKPPIKISYKKGVGFVVEDKSKKQTYNFKNFKQLTEFFSSYKQQWESAPYQDEEEPQYGSDPDKENDPDHKWNPDVQNDPNYKWSTKRREIH